MTDRIPSPRPPERAQPYRFPIVAVLAPVVVAVAIWLITSSAFALLFAALGPVTALASLVDSRFGARRTARREAVRFADELDLARSRVEAAHADEVAWARESVPSASELVGRSGVDPGRWRSDPRQPLLVALGVGPTRSGVEIDRVVSDDPEVSAALDDLAALARTIPRGWVTVDAREGIAIGGDSDLARALARAVIVELAWALSPADVRVAVADEWSVPLPHAISADELAPGVLARFADATGTPVASVAWAESEAALPGGFGIVVAVAGGSASITQHPRRNERRSFEPRVCSREQALQWATRAVRDATRDGLASAGASLPAVVDLEPMLRAPDPDDGSLTCDIGVGETRPLTLDLVSDGPHAIIGGTTGSGKSELLVTWVVAMAAAHPPERVTFLLVDFKGGAAFAPLAGLPHTVGIITDLDEAAATRALSSLRAELRYRERLLAEQGARDIEQVRQLPRLVIVVDEFAAMLADHPDLHALFADIAARGRSLGVHLILCTQRPAAAVRDGVLANTDLRICLRVNNRADSLAVIGVDDAAALEPGDRGRAIVVTGDGRPRRMQAALATPATVRGVAVRHPIGDPPRRPWCDPLPRVVEEVPTGSFGLLDLPHEQRRDAARYAPAVDGHLLVIGAARSGKSVALHSIAATIPDARWVGGDPEAAWDALVSLDTATGQVVVIDDLDSLLARFGPDYRAAAGERLAGVLRDGPGRDLHLLLSAQRITAEVQHLASLVPARLMLGQPNRQEHLLAGGDPASYVPGLPPGGGTWKGARVQVVRSALARVDASALVTALTAGPLAVVTTRPAMVQARLAATRLVIEPAAAEPRALTPSTAIVGDVEEWQSRWGALAAVRPVASVVFDGCSVSDFRALTRSRHLPPLLDPAAAHAWLLHDDGTASRVEFP